MRGLLKWLVPASRAAFWLGNFLDANTVAILVNQKEEDVHLLDLVSVISFCPHNQSSLLPIPHSLAVCHMKFEASSKDCHRIIRFSSYWPDAATSSSLCHAETLFDVLFVGIFDVLSVCSSVVWYAFLLP
jgi:hypothetical protein